MVSLYAGALVLLTIGIIGVLMNFYQTSDSWVKLDLNQHISIFYLLVLQGGHFNVVSGFLLEFVSDISFHNVKVVIIDKIQDF
jgi:hypothetical protein